MSDSNERWRPGERRLRAIRPLGTFHVNMTKDDEAHRRDGLRELQLRDQLSGGGVGADAGVRAG